MPGRGRRKRSWRGPAVPHLPARAPQPPVDPACGDAEDELPEPELPRREPPSLMLLDPLPDGLIASLGPEPLHGLPGARGQDAAHDLLAVAVPTEGAGGGIPEESLDGSRKSVGLGSRLSAFRFVRVRHEWLHFMPVSR